LICGTVRGIIEKLAKSDAMTLTPQKVHGIHYTPRDLAAFLAEQIVQRVSWEDRDIVVLDPACGDGELLSALVQATPADVRSRLVLLGYDTDGEAALAHWSESNPRYT
jgi:hypothetical protein